MTDNNDETAADPNVKETSVEDEEKCDEKLEEEIKKTFADLGLVKTLVDACNRIQWTHPTPIQEQVIPEAIKNLDVIGLAETGSGKTGAFVLPVLQGLLNNPIRGAVGAVILTPTRELALQINDVVGAIGESIAARSCPIVGGVDRTAQAIALARNPHLVIATPGRLVDHLKDTKGFHLRQVRYLVLDEADRMLSLDFEEELHQILDNISQTRQTMLFSATMTSQVQKLERASLSDPVRVQVSTKFQTPKQLSQSYLFIPAKYKDCYLTYVVNEHAGQSMLIFAATCKNVQRLALMLRNLGFPAVALHGQMSQSTRVGALQKFSSGSRTILVCTDVAARGLDLPQVHLVVNFDLPGHGKEYIHRCGRTARAGKPGKAIAFVTQYDVEVYQRIEGLLGTKLPAYNLEEETVLVLLERVSEAQRLATRELQEQNRRKGGNRRSRNDESSDFVNGLRTGYQGGSGGRGGALPNQRGGATKRKKHKR